MIVIDNLVKTYKGVEAVKGVSFKVDEGSITGFIGRNGAGKSTTLRGILGLCHMDQGQASIFEQDYKSLHNPSLSIGVVLDASKLHPSRTGYDTLLIAASINSTSKERIWEILGKCGLNKKQSKRLVKTYSLGMKQRLCIGMALLASPSVLVLDEPMNGLDPEGMMWIRKVLNDFTAQGGTVLISSHLLSEVERLADHVVMIKAGKIILDDKVSHLIKEGLSLEDIYIEAVKEGGNVYEVS